MIEHVSDHEAYLSEIIRLVRPDGLVVFTTPNAQIRLYPGMKPWNEFHVRDFTPAELRELLSTWFDTVEIRGLFGKEELHAIEHDRVARARDGARSGPAGVRRVLRQFVKRAFRRVISARDARRIRAQREEEPGALDPSAMARFSTQDLFYRSDCLDEALDLMAICRDPRRPSGGVDMRRGKSGAGDSP